MDEKDAYNYLTVIGPVDIEKAEYEMAKISWHVE
jgi:hypothetical protein